MFGLYRLSIFPSTRVIVWVWVSVHASIRLARRINCCAPFLLKIVQLLIRRNPDPSPTFRDQQRSTASRSFYHHHVCSATKYSAA